MMIDNGNHVILSGNRSALAYLALIGATNRMRGPDEADFNFVDLATKERWQLRLGDGVLPWWIFDDTRRVPNTRARDYLVLARLLWRPGQKSVGEIIDCSGALYERLLEPFLVATLNNDPALASARLAATLLRETIAAGGRTCRALIAVEGLSSAFVDPALAWLKARGAMVQFGHELHAINLHNGRADSLDFGNDTVHLGAEDAVILAVPPNSAARLLPGLTTPDEFHAIANVHFRVDGAKLPAMTGVVHAHDAVDFCLSRPPVGDHQRRRRADGDAARGAGAQGLDRSRRRCRPARGAAALAGRARAPRNHRHRSAAGEFAPGRANGVGQCFPGRRLDRDLLAADHRKRHPFGRARRRAGE